LEILPILPLNVDAVEAQSAGGRELFGR
jgi:hypothetical protein